MPSNAEHIPRIGERSFIGDEIFSAKEIISFHLNGNLCE